MTWLSLLFAALAWPCSPASLPECPEKEMVKLASPSLETLRAEVSRFQKGLGEAIKNSPATPRRANSCFNQGFAGMYISDIADFAKANRGRICPAHREIVKTQTEKLLDPGSKEWMEVAAEADKKSLAASAPNVRKALAEFLKK